MRLDSQQLRGVIAVPLPHHRPRYYWFPSPRGYRSFPHNPPPRLRAKIDTGIRTGRVDKKLFVEEYFSKVLSRVREIFGDLFEEAGDSRRQRLESRGILLGGYWPTQCSKNWGKQEAYLEISLFRLFWATTKRAESPIPFLSGLIEYWTSYRKWFVSGNGTARGTTFVGWKGGDSRGVD